MSKDYEIKLVATNKNVDDLSKKIVEEELKNLDVAERTREEQEWPLPSLCILKEWSLPSFRISPWTYTQVKWVEIKTSVLSSVIYKLRFLEVECPTL